ncbi:pectate lyase [Flavisolibacter ginsenosidimutans]|uniref:Pectate lyase n=1 Tax=Flavisolibacter ginsenosidimutans TaxID=661481 RepID=A0A5B8UN59_9BACT|nr:pectate lyase [Flavisolibacter ginsenosidimutans]QEC58018.1 pectate lyase [Flavisolibacter ginsenosidimutans]
MFKHFLYYPFIFSLCIVSCAQQKAATGKADEIALAFPSAEGFGKFTTGGRGGKVMVVKNLADAGEGSFREAAEAKFPRIIVFAVSGTIHLNTPLSIKGDATIAGQTAPGDGICLADQPVMLGGNNIIVRYMRFRMGDKNQKGGMVDGNGGDDAFGGTRRNKIIIDHCSMSWSTDEAFSVYGGDSTTLQWNLISEPLNYSYHFETGDKDYEHHGYGGIWGGRHTSAHHNLFAHCVSRTPRFDGARNIPSEAVDFCNNVIYDWGSNNAYAGEGGTYNMINNYYRPGPNTKDVVKNRIVNPYKKLPKLDYGKFYLSGNVSEASPDVTADNWKGVTMNEGTDADKAKARVDAPFSTEPITTQPAEEAYKLVLKEAGASYRRDTLDARIINDVKNRTGKIIDVQGGYPHGTAYEQTVNAWPSLKSLPAPKDSDGDGMPDEWEKGHGLNPGDASDASAIKLHHIYTNVEVYINSLAK